MAGISLAYATSWHDSCNSTFRARGWHDSCNSTFRARGWHDSCNCNFHAKWGDAACGAGGAGELTLPRARAGLHLAPAGGARRSPWGRGRHAGAGAHPARAQDAGRASYFPDRERPAIPESPTPTQPPCHLPAPRPPGTPLAPPKDEHGAIGAQTPKRQRPASTPRRGRDA